MHSHDCCDVAVSGDDVVLAKAERVDALGERERERKLGVEKASERRVDRKVGALGVEDWLPVGEVVLLEVVVRVGQIDGRSDVGLHFDRLSGVVVRIWRKDCDEVRRRNERGRGARGRRRKRRMRRRRRRRNRRRRRRVWMRWRGHLNRDWPTVGAVRSQIAVERGRSVTTVVALPIGDVVAHVRIDVVERHSVVAAAGVLALHVVSRGKR